MAYVNDGDEIKNMKASLSIIDLALAAGWTRDEGESTAREMVLRQGGDKITVVPGRSPGIKEVFTCRDTRVSGTVLDFAMMLVGSPSIGDARKYLRPYLSNPPRAGQRPAFALASPAAAEAGPEELSRRWDAMAAYKPGNSRGYLEGRGISAEVITAWAGQIRVDNTSFRNVCFAHRRAGEITVTGWEIKNKENKGYRNGYCRGGHKALFAGPDDVAAGGDVDSIVVVEGAIDALSYHQLFLERQSRRALYCSTAGRPSREQLDQLISLAVGRNARQVIVATDADKTGDEIAAEIIGAMPDGLAIRNRPTGPGNKDWNDYLNPEAPAKRAIA